MPTSLATLESFAEFRGITFDPTDVKAQRTLDAVSGFVRLQTGQRVLTVEDDIQDLQGTWDREMWLPQIPVQALGAVALRCEGCIEFEVLGADTFTWTRQGQLYRGSGWGGTRSLVRVTYDHGYEEGHELLGVVENLVCSIASRTMSNPGQVASESIGTYSVTYADVSAAGLTTMESEALDRLRNPHP